jgi:hypothetical protein
VTLAEPLIRFQGCCRDCHQAAAQGRTDSPHKQIGLAAYLDSTAGLWPEVLSCKTLASQTDDPAGRPHSEARKQVFCCLDPREDVPHIALDEDERVSSGGGVNFDVDSIMAFPRNLAVAKRGNRWPPTKMAVSDLRPILVYQSVHQMPHNTFGRIVDLKTSLCISLS